MSKLILFCAASLAFSGMSLAQNGVVSGQVTDIDGLPVEGVTVIAGGASASTDAGGLYLLTDVEQSERVLVGFSKPDFANTFGIVDLSGDGTDDPGSSNGACPDSDTRPVVMMGERHTGVANIVLDTGCTLQDEVFACSDAAEIAAGEKVQKHIDKDKDPEKVEKKRHKELGKVFEKCVKDFAKDLRKDDVIDKDDEKALKETAKDVRKAEDELPLPRDGGGPPPAGPTSATLDKTILAAGMTQSVDAQMGGTLEQDGFIVSFGPGAIDATGAVDVVITPIDVATSALGAFPGDFQALSVGGDPVLLETFSLMSVELSQNGQPVDLAPGSVASLEFLLPAGTAVDDFANGMIPLWSFDEVQGIWVEDGSAIVGASTTVPGRLAAFGDVSHFSWWNCDKPIETQTSIAGRVVDSAGDPVAGVGVRASGVDYFGTSYAQTNADGEYCVNVRISSVVDISGSLVAGGSSLETNTLSNVSTGDVNLRCQDGPAQTVVDLVLPGLSCVTGTVLDEGGLPVPDVLVQTTDGGFATTNENGQYCLTAPADSEVLLYSPGYAAVTATTPTGEASCAEGNCTVAPDLEPTAAGTTVCMRGRVLEEFDSDGSPVQEPLPNALVIAFNNMTEQFYGQDVTDAAGEYCIEEVDFDVTVFMSVQPEDDGGPFKICDGLAEAYSGVAPGSCGAPETCVVVPDEICRDLDSLPQ